MSAPGEGGARLRVLMLRDVSRALSRQARAFGPRREALS